MCRQVLLQDMTAEPTFLTNFGYAVWPPSAMQDASDLAYVLPNDRDLRGQSLQADMGRVCNRIRLACGVLALARKQHL